MLPVALRVSLSIAVLVYFSIIIIFLKKKSLELKYTLLWLLAGVIMAVFIWVPKLLYIFVTMMGIESNMNGLYILCIGFLIILLMSITSIVSKQTNRIRSLVQSIAVLEKRIRELEEKIGE